MRRAQARRKRLTFLAGRQTGRLGGLAADGLAALDGLALGGGRGGDHHLHRGAGQHGGETAGQRGGWRGGKGPGGWLVGWEGKCVDGLAIRGHFEECLQPPAQRAAAGCFNQPVGPAPGLTSRPARPPHKSRTTGSLTRCSGGRAARGWRGRLPPSRTRRARSLTRLMHVPQCASLMQNKRPATPRAITHWWPARGRCPWGPLAGCHRAAAHPPHLPPVPATRQGDARQRSWKPENWRLVRSPLRERGRRGDRVERAAGRDPPGTPRATPPPARLPGCARSAAAIPLEGTCVRVQCLLATRSAHTPARLNADLSPQPLARCRPEARCSRRSAGGDRRRGTAPRAA